MYAAVLAFLAVLCLCFGAYAARMKRKVHASISGLAAASRRESELLEAVRVVTAASRDSTNAVLTALERTLRVLEPAIDAVLIFTPDAEELRCVHAAGPRAEHYASLRVRRDDAVSLPARAALCGHRVESAAEARALIPSDRAAFAVPMLCADGLAAIVYVSSAQVDRLRNIEPVVRVVAQAAAPYALAAERESDRANATYDALTGLYTPRAFRDKLHDELAAAQVCGSVSLALWFVDTDHFKRVNDTFGHGTGDMVLQRMAALLRLHTIPGIDVAARNGGDEFCAILHNVQKIACIERAQRFCEAVRTFDFGVDVPITASVGIAAYPYDAASASELLEVADAAMYHSKRSGRDRVSFSTGSATFVVYG